MMRSLLICRNIKKIDFTRENSFADKMIVHLYVLCLGVKDGVIHKLDAGGVFTVYNYQFKHLHM